MTASLEETRRLQLGWIGTGRMGTAMARRLLDVGADLAVWNRTRAKAEALEVDGAIVVGRPSDLAARDVVFTMVSASPDLEAVTLGEGGLLTDPERAPRVLVDCSTVSAAASQTVREAAAVRGTTLLAAPISGNPEVVAAGLASLAVSGPEDSFETVRPWLEALGRGVAYVGEGDAARTVKIAHNLLLGITIQALSEVTVLAQRAGVPRAAFLSFLNDSVMGSLFSRYKTAALVNLELAPTFTPSLLRKDLDLGLAAADELGARLPLTALTRERVQALIDSDRDDLDFAALVLLAAEEAGIELEPEGAAIRALGAADADDGRRGA
jgi:3-hydroxyisobutyrate dehydrogenase-like beta-hydroxyacid dehydrogenase